MTLWLAACLCAACASDGSTGQGSDAGRADTLDSHTTGDTATLADTTAAGDAPTDVGADAAADELPEADAPCPSGAPCDDGDPCTDGDHCAGGSCVGTPTSCDDGEACTVDSCDPAAGCVHDPCALHLRPCDDGLACTTGDTCRDGQCIGVAGCDDGDPCTADSCDPATAACLHQPQEDGVACDDGDACTIDDVCTAGGCAGAPDVATLACEPGPACLAATPIPSVPFTVGGDTTGETDDQDAAGCEGLYADTYTGLGSPDVLYRLTAPHAGTYHFALAAFEGALDAILSVHTACPGTYGATCLHAADVIGAGGEQLDLPLAEGQTVYVLVDGFGQEEGGPYLLSVGELETACWNGLDDDGDGNTDCEDPLCRVLDVDCSGAVLACSQAETLVASSSEVEQVVLLDGGTPILVPDPCNPVAFVGYDRILRIAAGETGRYRLSIEATGAGALSRLASSCPPEPDCAAPLGSPSTVVADWQAGESRYLLLDGKGKTTATVRIQRVETLCQDGSDDDGDGLTDCEDPDCLIAVQCGPAGTTCASPLVLSAPSTTASAAEAHDLYVPSTCAIPTGASPELVFSFTAAVTAHYHFSVSPDGASATLTVATACAAPDAICHVPHVWPGDVLLHAGETVWLFADAIACKGISGCPLTVDVGPGPPLETSCGDGANEDDDGLVDCVDPDCAYDVHCAADGDWCERPIVLDGASLLHGAAKIQVSAETVAPGVHADLQPWMCGLPAQPGPDLVYALTAPVPGRYRFTLSPDIPADGWSLTLATACPPAPAVCLAQDPATVETEALAGDELFVIVSRGPSSGTADGAFTLAVGLDHTCSPPAR